MVTIECLVDVRLPVQGLILVSIATSIPDLYTSSLAAAESANADAALTSVVHAATANISLALGIPWTILTARTPLLIDGTEEITFALVLLLSCTIITVIVLLLKRSC